MNWTGKHHQRAYTFINSFTSTCSRTITRGSKVHLNKKKTHLIPNIYNKINSRFTIRHQGMHITISWFKCSHTYTHSAMLLYAAFAAWPRRPKWAASRVEPPTHKHTHTIWAHAVCATCGSACVRRVSIISRTRSGVWPETAYNSVACESKELFDIYKHSSGPRPSTNIFDECGKYFKDVGTATLCGTLCDFFNVARWFVEKAMTGWLWCWPTQTTSSNSPVCSIYNYIRLTHAHMKTDSIHIHKGQHIHSTGNTHTHLFRCSRIRLVLKSQGGFFYRDKYLSMRCSFTQRA